MRYSIKRRALVIVCVSLTTGFAGWDQSAQSAAPLQITLAVRGAALLGMPAAPPVLPKPFALPAQPIVPASANGYMPSSWTVTPKGEFTLEIPIAVPPGRAGIAPSLSLDYASGSANGIAGVGWSLSGFSTITRGGRVWASHGASDGVDFSTHDRFYLDGQELAGVDATPYGGNGAEYRTRSDTFVRVHSTSAAALDPLGPEQFVVELGDGRTRTYAPVVAQQIIFDDSNKVFAHGAVRAEWRIVSEADASGNTLSYEYEDIAGPGGANAQDYWYEQRPSKIRYTANLTNGLPTHGPQDLAQRYVEFEYEDRPDADATWVAGVQRHHGSRLKSMHMFAPNPTATSLVWQYDFAYATGGDQRSLLSSVQRCESVGGCLWAKQFSYSAGSGVQFQSQPRVPAPIAASDYDLKAVSAPDGEVPAMQTLDLNGDGASDLLFGAGATQLWEQKYYGAPFDVSLSDGKFLGGGHSVWLSQRDASGQIQPLKQGISIARDEELLASANYGHVRLDESTVVDIDADGRDELVAAIDNLGAHEINLDPKLPPLYDCSFAELKWTAAGFVHAKTTPCTLLGSTNGSYKYYLPGEFPTFADFNGDGLPDRASPYNAAGWIGSNNPNDAEQFEFSPAWQVSINQTAKPGELGPATQYEKWEASPGVVTDLNGDGRAELTSEALKSSLSFDNDGEWTKQSPDSVHLPTNANSDPLEGYREFGDFNGDGLEDMFRLTRLDAAKPGTLTGQIFWNTGKGFIADTHTRSVSVDVHPDVAKKLATRFTDPGIHVTDLNNDGRADVVVFNDDHVDPQNLPAPEIMILLSSGDGTFIELHQPVSRGTRNDVKYSLDNALRPITFYPSRLENDEARLVLEAYGQVIPGAPILLQLVPFRDYVVVGGDDTTPGLASGWNLATLADINGDGLIDIVRHVGDNDPSGGFEVMQQVPQWGDELIAVTDEGTAWPALSVDYSSEWSDRAEVNDSYQCTYPLRCPKSGLRVVREVTSRANLSDPSPNDDPLQLGRTWQYSYRDPVANVQGLGFLGFSEFRSWDTEPTHPVETIATFDLRAPDPGGSFYPGVGLPTTVTIARPILQPGQGQPATAVARLTMAHYAYETRMLNGGATHAIFTPSTLVSEWEEPVSMAWSGNGPDHLHVSGYAEPASPPIRVSTQTTIDDYGNAVATVTHTLKGLTTTVDTPTVNDTANWHLGLVSERMLTTLEGEKGAKPVSQVTDYTYTSKGQSETIAIEKDNPDTSLTSTTALSYDDYGLLKGATTVVANEAPRTMHIEYDAAWPGAPDEHMYVTGSWSDHENAACAGDCRPAAWWATHPAYGVVVAAMNRNGAQAIGTYDGHGRVVGMKSDGELPVDVSYAGRADSFGGTNGIEIVATQGLQQRKQSLDARGAPLRSGFTGFDGQSISTFATYDTLGRRHAISRPTTAVASAWTNYDYDSLGRAVKIVSPDGSSASNIYHLLETEHTDADGHYSYQLYDVDGRLITSGAQVPGAPGCGMCLAQDINSTYQYSATAKGALDTVLDDQGHATQTQYDRRGRPVQEDEPSRGTTTVAYNGFGEPKTTIQVATGDTETDTYDDLGRLVAKTSLDGLTTYSWDIAANGIGRLARAQSPDQIITEYRYDELGRTIGIDQTDNLAVTRSLDMQFDASTGRLASIDYPKSSTGMRFRTAYDYNDFGYLKTVSDATPNQPQKILQQVISMNADLALVDAVRGINVGAGGGAIDDHREYDPLMGRLWAINATHAGTKRLSVNYNYDPDGLVTQRNTADESMQIKEAFDYDALHRLTHTSRNGMPLQAGLPFSSSTDDTYDSVGNRIDTTRNGVLVDHRGYGSNGSHPYALTARDVTDPAAPNQPPQALEYQYDELGRLKQDAHRSFKWTSFDLPRTVVQDGQTSNFLYDAAGSRVSKSGPSGTLTYLAGLYEQRRDGAVVRDTYHVIGEDGLVADVTYDDPPLSSGPTITFPLTDGLGTTNAIADAGGTVKERDYYDSWGLRSNPDGSALANLSLFQSLGSGGFTQQEHDDELGLINMRGRIYEPTLGRFLSPDPIVGNPAFSQSWNGYSYVLNSPLNFTDPSGLDPCPPGLYCTTGPGNEITNTIQTHYGDETFGGSDGGSDGGIAAGGVGAAQSTISGAFAFIQDMAELARQQHEVDAQAGRALQDGTRVRTADGTPILPRRINARKGNRLEDNWGYPIRGNVIGPGASRKGPVAVNGDGVLTRKAADFGVRLFCGSKCASASAPTSSREAAEAPKQLSSARIARNTLSQALAARALVKFLGKVGVVIDEGVDGIIERLMPDGMGMANEPDASKKPPQMLLSLQGDEEAFQLSPEEELEQFRDSYNEALKQYGFYAIEVGEVRRSGLGADKYGTPLWLLEQHMKSWGQALDEAGDALKAAEGRIKKRL